MVVIDPEQHELLAVTERLPAVPGRVLEIGCGDGRLTRRYSPRAASVVAIDPDASLIAAFREAGVDPNVEPPHPSDPAAQPRAQSRSQPNSPMEISRSRPREVDRLR